ncbi:hypothetical protein CSA56_11735 [candidate division KSB3 bacterium]|uniref:Uncharacterized protein n=1 Tax=candidate division KSB3 bacterium TaxID=2044937 RepID=A0A2G6KF86_9BACT|nr:MAG: hypothetical protein CSA56_11735 [candidate division KSB3 bacterium]
MIDRDTRCQAISIKFFTMFVDTSGISCLCCSLFFETTAFRKTCGENEKIFNEEDAEVDNGWKGGFLSAPF